MEFGIVTHLGYILLFFIISCYISKNPERIKKLEDAKERIVLEDEYGYMSKPIGNTDWAGEDEAEK